MILPQPEILIVDDDPNFRVLLEEYFNKQGFRAAAVGDGKDAITMLSEREFDVALLDLVMPGMDGYDVMDYINDRELATHMIVITGHASKQSAVASLRKGVYDFLGKPFDMEELYVSVQNAVGLKRSQEEKRQAKAALLKAYNGMEAEIRKQKADLTRKEALTREVETKYISLTNNLNVGVYRNTAGQKGNFIEVNPAIVKMFGYASRDEFMRVNVSDLYEDPSQRLKFSQGLTQKGKVKNVELVLKRRDQSRFVGSVSAVAIKDSKGQVQFYDGIVEDITEKKAAEEALIRNERWFRTLTRIGLSLSAEKDTKKLLERIVIEARKLCNADAGTLYLLDRESQELRFEIVQNESLQVKMGGESGSVADFPNVPLFVDGKPNHTHVCSKVALGGQSINLSDVYGSDGEPYPGPKAYDALSGYQTRSMLVLPLKNHENVIIGVLQLLNAKDPDSGDVIAFAKEFEDLIASLASQAAVALTNAQLITDLNRLFYAFIRGIATAIDEKSPYTGGHINRVVHLSMMLARQINRAKTGPFKNRQFSDDEMEELRLSAWMHDVGKVTTPENIVNKSSKLEAIFDRYDLIETRFALIASAMVNSDMAAKLKYFNQQHPDATASENDEHMLSARLKELHRDLEFIKSINHASQKVTADQLARLKSIGQKEVIIDDKPQPYLTEDEIENLSIRYGNLSQAERRIVENHANMTLKILKQLSFPSHLARVPEFAGGHHEKLDGSGYPQGLSAQDLPLQTRILAIVDIFEALTARDRPYREPMKLSEAIKIIQYMKANNKIDPDLYDLLMDSGIYYEYARREMDPKQIDVPEPKKRNKLNTEMKT